MAARAHANSLPTVPTCVTGLADRADRAGRAGLTCVTGRTVPTPVTDTYDAHGIAWFRTTCKLNAHGKKEFVPPKDWAALAPNAPSMRRAGNAVCIRTGPGAHQAHQSHQAHEESEDLEPRHIVVVDADGADAIVAFERVLARSFVTAPVPQVQTQRGPSGRHFYFFAEPGSLAATLKSTTGLTFDGVKTGIDIRAGYKGPTKNEGVGFVFAPPTVVVGGGAYTLMPESPAIHEAPFMPDSLARALADAGASGTTLRSFSSVGAVGTVGTAEAIGAIGAVDAIGAVGTAEPVDGTTDLASDVASALASQALRAAQVRAGTANVGFPTRVVPLDKQASFGTPYVRIEFSHTRGTSRVCPVSREVHESNHFFVMLGVDEERTGLPAFFVYCHSTKACNPRKRHQMLAFVDPASYAALGIREDLRLKAAPSQSVGQTIVMLGKMQEQVDRLVENPGGAWDTITNVGVIACSLATAASGHAAPTVLARSMLDQLLVSSKMRADEKQVASFGFSRANLHHDPVGTLRAYAEGLSGKRDQELMMVREAITACTDPALEANVPKAAESLLQVLDYCERRDSHGKTHSHGNFADLGMFLYFVWRRVARYGFDRTQSSAAHQWTFYLFNGATYERGQFEQLEIKAKRHMRSIVAALLENVQLHSRVASLELKCKASDFVARAIAEMQLSFKDVEQLGWCGLISPNDFQLELDMGNYIGFKNGVYDILNDRFLPRGSVPLNVLVSMCTNYDYVGPEDPKFLEMRAQIEEFYRKLHADDYENPNDERLAAMWLLSGSLLFRGNVCKKAFVFLGSEGDNGKSTFTELIQLTLGDYAVTGNRSSLSGTQEQMTLDPDLVANHKSLVCTFPEVQSIEGGVSSGFKFNCGKLKALTGNDEQSVRGLYRDKKGIIIGFKPILHSNFMPLVDSDDAAARNRLWVARFGSTFPADLVEPDVHRRRFPRIENLRETMRGWAPYHFLLMLEALRDFRRRNCVLPVGAQQIEGSLMHQEIVSQTPEGRLRAWVEANYTHIPLREKDTGTKLEALFGAYTTATPPIHQKLLGRNKFAAMLAAVYPGIGPHRNKENTVKSMYLVR